MGHALGSIERGRILDMASEGYVVESLDRDGIVSPPIASIGDEVYAAGDLVLFVLFADGTGKILSDA